jgi:hypothetical protein
MVKVRMRDKDADKRKFAGFERVEDALDLAARVDEHGFSGCLAGNKIGKILVETLNLHLHDTEALHEPTIAESKYLNTLTEKAEN